MIRAGFQVSRIEEYHIGFHAGRQDAELITSNQPAFMMSELARVGLRNKEN